MFAGPHRHVFLYWFDALRGREVDKFGPEDVIELVRNAPIIEYPWHTELLNNLSGPLTVVVVAILYAALYVIHKQLNWWFQLINYCFKHVLFCLHQPKRRNF